MSTGFSILGDSISTLAGWVPDDWRIHYEGEAHIPGVKNYEDTWWGQVIEHFGGHLVSNSSFSGSVIEGFGFPAACSPERIAHLVGADGELPDVVIIHMGINDYGWAGGRNQVMGRSTSASAKPEDLPGPKIVTDLAADDALDLFRAALESTIRQIHELAPEAQVWCTTLAPGGLAEKPWPNFCFRLRGIEMDDYNEVFRAVCAAEDAHVADLRAFNIAYDTVDGVHPSALGMRQIAQMIIAEMEGKGHDASSIPELEGALPVMRACFEESCAGCSHVEVEQVRWSLYCDKYDDEALRAKL